MYLIRDVLKSDLPGLKKLAHELDTVNLPNDERELTSIIEKSARSFDGRIREVFEREYLFVMEEPRSGKVVGSSLIISQHGTRDAPHIFFDVYEKEHYSHSVDRHFRHRVLSIGYNFDGLFRQHHLGVAEDAARPHRPEAVAALGPLDCDQAIVRLVGQRVGSEPLPR